MIINKAVSIPLITHDPFTSIWSSADHLYDKDMVHWCGASQTVRGYLIIDGVRYVFMGDYRMHRPIPQKSIDVTATSTKYEFENDLVSVKCRFTSPLLLNDMVLVSRPCTYIDIEVEKKNASNVELEFEVLADVVRQDNSTLIGFSGHRKDYNYTFMGRAVQQPLKGSGDKTAIDWGYVYLASQEKGAQLKYSKYDEKIGLKTELENKKPASFLFAFDDLLSINYFGQWRKAYWTNTYATILDAIAAAFADKEETLKKAAALDKDIEEKSMKIGGESYVYLCNMSYRQVISAHKLITDDEGNVLFLSKENASNGCIGTVDVSYPSVPLFLLYDTEYIKGMLRPIFKFTECDVWEYDFAPHDVGRYPYAWGQAYAYRGFFGDNRTEPGIWDSCKNGVYPPFYMYPAGSNIYDIKYQMPVEECGNMLIMTAAICKIDGNAKFAKPYWNILKTWKNYLIKFGTDPGNQLCTDDFAGHLEHNANLSVKTIMGIYAYAMIAEMLGEKEEADKHYALAKEMAANWEKKANAGDHYVLAFGKLETWSLKYNLVWDKIWGSNLFSDEVYEKEIAYYIKNTMEYGTPLDSRCNYAKSDWILWCATMTQNKEQAENLIKPVAHYLENSEKRAPFSDWYYADTGRYCGFMARSVQGGIFMPIFRKYGF